MKKICIYLLLVFTTIKTENYESVRVIFKDKDSVLAFNRIISSELNNEGTFGSTCWLQNNIHNVFYKLFTFEKPKSSIDELKQFGKLLNNLKVNYIFLMADDFLIDRAGKIYTKE